MGHTTGGLILTLVASKHTIDSRFDGIILNSPFFQFNLPPVQKKIIPLLAALGKIFPKVKVTGGFSENYGIYLHQAAKGEWDYNLQWKPHIAPKVNLGWIRAIYNGQKALQKPFSVQQPVLVMHAATSGNGHQTDSVLSTDIILNIRDIDRTARNIRGDVEIISIPGGIHDLILSRKPVREKAYDILFEWIERKFYSEKNTEKQTVYFTF